MKKKMSKGYKPMKSSNVGSVSVAGMKKSKSSKKKMSYKKGKK